MAVGRSADEARFHRFSVTERAEHWLLVASFTTLAVTGLVQMFAGAGPARALIGWLGGLSGTQMVHRIAAGVFGTSSVIHVASAAYALVVRGRKAPMLPAMEDVRDFFREVAFNLGRATERPSFGRFSYAEKMEYWALLWGVVVMGLTGVLMWDTARTAAVLPFVVVPVARAVHGYEALLAVLAVLTWHVYHVHVRHFNRSMFRGWLSRKEMEELHPLELDRPEPPPGSRHLSVGRRALAVALSAVVVVGCAAAVAAWARITPPAAEPPIAPEIRPIARSQEWGPPVPHPVSDRPGCMGCHGLGQPVQGPEFVLALPEQTCGHCHDQGAPVGPTAGEGTAVSS